MNRHTSNGLEWLTFDLLEEVTHAVVTKINLALHTDPKAVELNFDFVKETLHLPKLISSNQIHEDHIAIVNAHSRERLEGFDALVTKEKGIALLTSHADCQSALFYDPIQKVIANVHSGWRGSVKNIYKKTIETLVTEYDSKKENILVCISPSLSPENAEFTSYKLELPKNFWQFQVKENHFDFWAISEMQLKEAGILSHHIEIASLCTLDNPQDFHSYRRQKREGHTGPLKAGNASIIML